MYQIDENICCFSIKVDVIQNLGDILSPTRRF